MENLFANQYHPSSKHEHNPLPLSKEIMRTSAATCMDRNKYGIKKYGLQAAGRSHVKIIGAMSHQNRSLSLSKSCVNVIPKEGWAGTSQAFDTTLIIESVLADNQFSWNPNLFNF